MWSLFEITDIVVRLGSTQQQLPAKDDYKNTRIFPANALVV